jgi:hypothetical protein
MDLPKTRNEALIAQSQKYFTGEPCKRGHIAPRYTVNALCMECNAEDRRRERKDRSFSGGNAGIVRTTVSIRRADLPRLFAFIGSLDSAAVENTVEHQPADVAAELERIHGSKVAQQLQEMRQ